MYVCNEMARKYSCSELSAERYVSLELQKKTTEDRLTDECTRLKRDLEATRDGKKDVERKLEKQRQVSVEQLERQRLGN